MTARVRYSLLMAVFLAVPGLLLCQEKRRAPAGFLNKPRGPRPLATEAEPSDDLGDAERREQQKLAELIASHKQQCRVPLRLELQFLERVCRLDLEQLALLRNDADIIQDQVAETWARRYSRPKENRNQPEMAYGTPRIQLREQLIQVVRRRLHPAQVVALDAELAARGADRRKNLVDCVVARIDSQVELTPEQREALHAALTAQADWPPASGAEYSPRDLPPIPPAILSAVLNAAQLEIWTRSTLLVQEPARSGLALLAVQAAIDVESDQNSPPEAAP